MPRVKIQLADNIKRVVTFDTDATVGATLGTNLLMPNGQIGTPASVLQWLGGAISSQPSGGNNGIPIGTYLTTKGDLLTRDTQVQRLPIGSTGQVLLVQANLPVWGVAGVAGGGTGHAAYNVGDMLYADTPDSLETVSAGPDGWVLTMYGGLPDWAPPAGGGVQEVDAGTGIDVDNTDPDFPIVSLDAATQASLALADSAVQPGDLGIGDLNDVDLSGLTDGDILIWDNSTSQWVVGAAPSAGVESVTQGVGINVDNTDPANPVVSLDAAVGDLSDVDLSDLEDGFVLVYDASTSQWVASEGGGIEMNSAPETRGASFSGGVSAIIAPTNDVPVYIREDCTLHSVIILTRGGSGSCVVDIWKKPYGTYPPTVANSICPGVEPSISTGVKYQNSVLTGFDTTLSADDTLLIHLTSSSTFTAISVFLVLIPVGSTPMDGYTDERVRDVMGVALTTTPTIAWTVNDLGETIEADVDLTADFDWTGMHLFSGVFETAVGTSGVSIGQDSGYPAVTFISAGGATNGKLWQNYTAPTGEYVIAAVNDANSASHNLLAVTRSGLTITGIVYGNATDLPPHSFYGPITTSPSVAANAGMNIPHGTAPSSPANGDMWTTTAGLFVRINGVTVSFTGGSTSGDYAVTTTSLVNLTSAAQVENLRYTRIGDIVRVFGPFTVDPIAAAGAQTSFQMNLPFASNFAGGYECSGNGVVVTITPAGYDPVLVVGDNTTDKAVVSWFANDTTAAQALYIDFSYRVIP